mmetsp:Transcript_34107/g.54592  ORF Transcript_34107/g.54592 Transcript_34107/m.54592 type:complete len:1709 (+) Transcript_34107:145-5271(+)
MKNRVLDDEESFEEAVRVNQRALIDKILARYSTDLTLFRELLQNADDAKATSLEIRFSGTEFWKKGEGELSYTGLRIGNNGITFRDEDWARIKSIADGNPDEEKIGFFGVGFYSVFSMSDEPTVMSGKKALSFHWKKDALFVTHGKIPEPLETDGPEELRIFKLVGEEGWTVFDLPVRKDPPHPRLPKPRDIAQFLISCLTFTSSLKRVNVFYDDKLAVTVARQSTGEVSSLGEDLNFADPRGMFRYKDGFAEPLLYAVKFHDKEDPMIVEMIRVQVSCSVHVDRPFMQAMYRVTKKNPPKNVKIQLIFDVGKSTKLEPGLESFSPASKRGGFFFIGSGITQQTTGTKCHCNAPFMPTMERNAMDLADVTLATWNRGLLWIAGASQRVAYQYRCTFGAKKKREKKKRSSEVQSGLFSSWFSTKEKVVEEEQEVEKELVQLPPREEQRMIVLSTMATFAMKPTTPVSSVGELVKSGFFAALGSSPMIWTNNGSMMSTRSRLKDNHGIHELIEKAVSIVDIPKPEQTENVTKKIAKSALGFFSSFLGTSSSKEATEPEHETVASLCQTFVHELRNRNLLRVVDLSDLHRELTLRPLDKPQVEKLFRVLLCQPKEERNSLLQTAIYEGKPLARLSRFIGGSLLSRIEQSAEKGMSTRLLDVFWSHASCKERCLWLDIRKSFSDSELGELGIKQVQWIEWIRCCYQVLAKKEPPLALEDMCIASNLIRVIAFAIYTNELHDQKDLTVVLSTMQSLECVPVQSHSLIKPEQAYLGAESTGGFTSLPIVVVCERLEDGTFVMTQNTPRDSAVVSLLSKIGVKQHIDLAFVFSEFNKGSLGWNRQEILIYIASMRSKLTEPELARLKKFQFLPAVEIRSEDKAFPSLASHDARVLHFPSPALNALKIPMVYSLKEEGVPVTNLFKDMPTDRKTLLEELGVQTHPPIRVLFERIVQPEFQPTALAYLIKHFDKVYKKDYRLSTTKLIPCTDGGIYAPAECFSNASVGLLGKPVIDTERISKVDAKTLGVKEDPPRSEIIIFLKHNPPRSEQHATMLFEYLSTLTMSQSDLNTLKNIKFIPVGDRQVEPSSIFFRTGEVGKYEGLFPYVDVGASQGATVFLRTVGVRNEPSVDELAVEISTSEEKTAQHVQRVGYEAYLQILRVLAVEFTQIKYATKRRMAQQKCLVGIEKKNEDVVHRLERASNLYISDNDVMDRMFNPLIAPQESILETMYESLGAKPLTTAVVTKTVPKSPYKVTALTILLEEKIRNRVQLLFFKRQKSDFVSNINKWLSVVNDSSKHFVYHVPAIKRTMQLNNVVKVKSCQAYAHAGEQILMVTEKYTMYECAAELTSILLKKGTLHDSLLWSTIIQSSDDMLREQGFPVARVIKPIPPKPVKPKQVPENPKQAPLPQQAIAPNSTSPVPVAAEIPEPRDQAQQTQEPQTQEPKKLGGVPPVAPLPQKEKKSRSFRDFISSALPKKQPQKQPPPQTQPQAAPPPRPQQGGKSLLEDSNTRKRLLQDGLNRCNSGGDVDSIKQDKRVQQAIQQQLPKMDDLHDHDLVRVPYRFEGLECYVEQDESSSASIYQDRGVEATAFAQLLNGLSTRVFGMSNKSVCHIYYHHQGSTAAFNRGGALFFNLDVYLSQLDSSSERMQTVMGPDMQPRFITPRAIMQSIYAIYCHELSHNHIHQHDAAFANWMSMYFVEYLDNLQMFIDTPLR